MSAVSRAAHLSVRPALLYSAQSHALLSLNSCKDILFPQTGRRKEAVASRTYKLSCTPRTHLPSNLQISALDKCSLVSPQPGQLGTVLTVKGPSKAGCTELAYATFLSNPGSNKDVLKQARNIQKYLHIHALAYTLQHISARHEVREAEYTLLGYAQRVTPDLTPLSAGERIKLIIITCINYVYICHVFASTYITHMHSPRGFFDRVGSRKRPNAQRGGWTDT